MRRRSAVSDAARSIRTAARRVGARAEKSHALFGSKADAISDIHALVHERAEAVSDGEDVRPIAPGAVLLAEDFIRALPRGFPLPGFAPEPDGSIGMDWYRARNHVFSLSVGTDDRLAYAWLDGTDRGHAVSRFDGERVPSRILAGIATIMKLGNASFWAA